MKRQIFAFLKKYSTNPVDVDRLIVSSFINLNKVNHVNNDFLREYLIPETDSDDFKLLTKFISILNKEIPKFEIETLIELFEFVISPSDRIVTGAIYTPLEVREYILSEVLNQRGQIDKAIKISDVACGCGGFLLTASRKLKQLTGKSYFEIFRDNIFGVDIQDYSIVRTKLILTILALTENEDVKVFDFNLHVGDSLSFNWADHIQNFNGFDIIVGNPPYVRLKKLTAETKALLKNWEVAKTGLTDLYIPFFQIGYENLVDDGILGYITMNSFFKSLNGRALRSYFDRKRPYFKIIDFGGKQIFKSRNTYTCICFLQKTKSENILYSYAEEIDAYDINDYGSISYNDLDSQKGWNLKNRELVEKFEKLGVPFGKSYKTRHGIATLRNDIYIFKPIKEDNLYYYLKDTEVYQIEKNACRNIVNSNKLSREKDLNDIMEKVIFPYTNDAKPKLLQENFFKQYYPKAYAYLKSKKNILAERDNGNGTYENWFAFGRTQSLEKMRYKLFFPKFSDQNPCCIIDTDENLLFYNGLAVVGNNEQDLQIIKKILESDIFWFYIRSTSKPYSSKYYSLNGTYINNFGIPAFNKDEVNFLLNTLDRTTINDFLSKKYGFKNIEEMY